MGTETLILIGVGANLIASMGLSALLVRIGKATYEEHVITQRRVESVVLSLTATHRAVREEAEGLRAFVAAALPKRRASKKAKPSLEAQ